MAGRGPLPKEERQRERDTKRRSSEFADVERDGVLRGPTLAKATGSADWPAEVRAWWEDWRRSPMAQTFESTDWRRLAMLAPIVAAYYRRPSAAALAEIRQNETLLSATYADRLRNRVRVNDPAPLAPVSSIDSARRQSLRDRLADDEGEE